MEKKPTEQPSSGESPSSEWKKRDWTRGRGSIHQHGGSHLLSKSRPVLDIQKACMQVQSHYISGELYWSPYSPMIFYILYQHFLS